MRPSSSLETDIKKNEATKLGVKEFYANMGLKEPKIKANRPPACHDRGTNGLVRISSSHGAHGNDVSSERQQGDLNVPHMPLLFVGTQDPGQHGGCERDLPEKLDFAAVHNIGPIIATFYKSGRCGGRL